MPLRTTRPRDDGLYKLDMNRCECLILHGVTVHRSTGSLVLDELGTVCHDLCHIGRSPCHCRCQLMLLARPRTPTVISICGEQGCAVGALVACFARVPVSYCERRIRRRSILPRRKLSPECCQVADRVALAIAVARVPAAALYLRQTLAEDA